MGSRDRRTLRSHEEVLTAGPGSTQTAQERPAQVGVFTKLQRDAQQPLKAFSFPLDLSPSGWSPGGGTHSPTVPKKSMALFMISIPLMVVAVALAVLPLILVSHSDHRRRKAETNAGLHCTSSEPVAAVDAESVLVPA